MTEEQVKINWEDTLSKLEQETFRYMLKRISMDITTHIENFSLNSKDGRLTVELLVGKEAAKNCARIIKRAMLNVPQEIDNRDKILKSMKKESLMYHRLRRKLMGFKVNNDMNKARQNIKSGGDDGK